MYTVQCTNIRPTTNTIHSAPRLLTSITTASVSVSALDRPPPPHSYLSVLNQSAYAYVNKAGGLERDQDYPYTSYYDETGKCKADSKQYVVTVQKYSTIKGEGDMASYMQSTGPIAVCLDASNWNTYKKGVLKVCGNKITHCVQAVGVDTSEKYWLLRNSWGTHWGEGGYIQISYGSNTCDVTNNPTVTKVKAVE
jgi:cathepsin F